MFGHAIESLFTSSSLFERFGERITVEWDWCWTSHKTLSVIWTTEAVQRVVDEKRLRKAKINRTNQNWTQKRKRTRTRMWVKSSDDRFNFVNHIIWLYEVVRRFCMQMHRTSWQITFVRSFTKFHAQSQMMMMRRRTSLWCLHFQSTICRCRMLEAFPCTSLSLATSKMCRNCVGKC